MLLVGQRLHISHDHHLIRSWGISHEKRFDVDEVFYHCCVKKLLVGYLLSLRPSGEERGIEVKGRAGVGDIEITENEWVKACNLRDRYWLYVVYECATAHPHLLRIPDPFGTLIVRAKGSVIIDEPEIFAAAEGER